MKFEGRACATSVDAPSIGAKPEVPCLSSTNRAIPTHSLRSSGPRSRRRSGRTSKSMCQPICPDDLLAKLRELHARRLPISHDDAFFLFGGGMTVRNLCRERLSDRQLRAYSPFGG